MDDKIEQRVCIKFCVKLDKSATETLEMLREAFEEHSLSRTAVSEWHSRFKAGLASVEDDERSGRPSTSKTAENVEKIREHIHEDRR
jgi:transposase